MVTNGTVPLFLRISPALKERMKARLAVDEDGNEIPSWRRRNLNDAITALLMEHFPEAPAPAKKKATKKSARVVRGPQLALRLKRGKSAKRTKRGK